MQTRVMKKVMKSADTDLDPQERSKMTDTDSSVLEGKLQEDR